MITYSLCLCLSLKGVFQSRPHTITNLHQHHSIAQVVGIAHIHLYVKKGIPVPRQTYSIHPADVGRHAGEDCRLAVGVAPETDTKLVTSWTWH